jgi:hypothetical protein
LFGDEATCLSRGELACAALGSLPGLEPAAAAWGACAGALSQMSCAQIATIIERPDLMECRLPPGTLTAGAPCRYSEQCGSGRCSIEKGAACGTCAANADAGTGCKSDRDCLGGQQCAGYLGKLACHPYRNEGDPCDSTFSCNLGLTCSSRTAGGTCVRPALAGQGQPCTAENALSCDLLSGLACDSSARKCVPISLASEGQACGLVNGAPVACKAGRCRIEWGMSTGHCSGVAADGAGCASSDSCLYPATCGTCLAGA